MYYNIFFYNYYVKSMIVGMSMIMLNMDRLVIHRASKFIAETIKMFR